MLLEINIGLLTASAIVASLINTGLLPTNAHYRAMKNAVRFFAFSTILSLVMLTELLQTSITGIPFVPDLVIAILTYVSILFFVAGSTFLSIVGFKRFETLEKKTRKKTRG